MMNKKNNDLNNCALCLIPLTSKNNSAEHIIPNAIGGRLKVKNFICEECNNTSGKDWESKLTKALNPLSVHFQIKRQKGVSPPLKFKRSDGNEYLLKHDGSITPARVSVATNEISETQTEIRISAPSSRKLKKHLAGLKRKHPTIDIDECMRNLKLRSDDFDEPIHFQLQFGGVDFGKSLVKSALAWASYNQIDMNDCKTALKFMRSDNIPACYDYAFDNEVIICRPNDEVFHCVALSNRNRDNQLLAYIEYYNVYRLVVILNDDYQGKDIHEIYAINPIKGEKININFQLNYSKSELKKMFDRKSPEFGGLKRTLEDTLFNHNRFLRSKNLFENILDEAISESGFDPDKILTEDGQRALSRQLAEYLYEKLKKLDKF